MDLLSAFFDIIKMAVEEIGIIVGIIITSIGAIGALAGYAFIILLAFILILVFFEDIAEIYKGFLNEDKSGASILKNKLTSILKFIEKIIKQLVLPFSIIFSIIFSIGTHSLAIKNLAIIIFAILFFKEHNEKDNY